MVVVSSYLGEEGSPDGLDILDLGGLDEGLDLVGLYHCENGFGQSTLFHPIACLFVPMS